MDNDGFAKRAEGSPRMRRASRVALMVCFVTLCAMAVYAMNSHGCSNDRVDDDGTLTIVALTIYYTDASESARLADSDLAAIGHTQVATSIVRGAFGTCTRRDPPTLWKGSLLGVARLADGSEHRLALSKYGGFFMMIGNGKWYSVDGRSRAAYNAMIAGLSGGERGEEGSAP
jgi:hypothetical protein